MTSMQKILLMLGGGAAGFVLMNKMSGGHAMARNRRFRGQEMHVDDRTLFLLQEWLSAGKRNVYVDRDYSTDAYIGRIERTGNNLVRAFPPASYGALDGEPSDATSVAMRKGQLFRNIRAAVSYLLRLYVRAEERALQWTEVREAIGAGLER